GRRTPPPLEREPRFGGVRLRLRMEMRRGRNVITIAICTWNRAAMLDRILAQLHALIVPPGVEYEVVVVNNNCTDDTDAILEKHAKQLPLRRSFEPTAG